MNSDAVLIPVSLGELADKITILQIKSEKITDDAKLANVRNELSLLQDIAEDHRSGDRATLDRLISELRLVNERLWEIEDEIRDCERAQQFGERFIELARSVYRQNDHRAALKREISVLAGSHIIEEKSYVAY